MDQHQIETDAKKFFLFPGRRLEIFKRRDSFLIKLLIYEMRRAAKVGNRKEEFRFPEEEMLEKV